MFYTLIAAVLMGAATPAERSVSPLQIPTPPTAKIEAMKKLDHWVGEWKGTGWAFVQGGQRVEYTITERIQRKIGGSIFLVEGQGKGKEEGTGKEFVAHDALAVVSFDPKTKRYRFRAHDLRGQDIDTELKLVEGGAQWEFGVEGAPVTIRFTIKLGENRWVETGEVSLDAGKTWQQFMEMKLERVKEAVK